MIKRTQAQTDKEIADADATMEALAAKTAAKGKGKKPAAKKVPAAKKAPAAKKEAAPKKEAKPKKETKPRNTSGVENPVQLIWDTCGAEWAKAQEEGRALARKEVWAILEPQGVNANTFARQWQEWKASGGMA